MTQDVTNDSLILKFHETPEEGTGGVWVTRKGVCCPASPRCRQDLTHELPCGIAHAPGTHIMDFIGVAHEMQSGKSTNIETITVTLDVLDDSVGWQVVTNISEARVGHANSQRS